MPPIVIAAGIAAAGAVTASAVSSSSASSASDKQMTAEEKAQKSQEDLAREGMQFQQTQATRADQLLRDFNSQAQTQLKPFQDAQLAALQQAQGLTDANNPYYQQQQAQGTQAIQRELAAQGLLRSKNQVDLLTNLQLGLNQQRVSQVNSIANLGAVQQGAQNTMQLGGGLADIANTLGANVGSSFQALGAANANSLARMGQISAQGTLQQGQIWGGLANQFGNIAQGTLGNYQSQQNQQWQQNFLQQLIGGNKAFSGVNYGGSSNSYFGSVG
jgi:hypothetical protein